MLKIIVLGAGVMGSAFAQLLADTGNEVFLVGTHLDEEIITSIRSDGIHPGLNVQLPGNVFGHYNDQLDDILDEEVRLIVIGVNSAGVDWAVKRLGPLLNSPLPIVMLTKGLAIQNQAITILPRIVEEIFINYGIGNVPLAAVTGPCIAGELAARRQTSVVFASQDTGLLEWLSELVNTPYYHVRGSTDLIGSELCAALKNFYTLAVGYAAGQLEKHGIESNSALMHNPASGLFTQALAEMEYFVNNFGGRRESVFGLPGAGDLYVTCQAGRNGRMGKLLGSGLLYREAKKDHMPNDTIEGAELALTIGRTVKHLAGIGQINAAALPLTMGIIHAICENQLLQIPWDRFYR